MRNRTYFLLKPLLPWGLRMAVRRWHARRVRRQAHGWPILPSAGRRPAGWTGWPEGHRWTFVSTHDVEGAEGLARVRRLAELEMSLGFRSTFNFIPEGPYRVPPELRAWLVDHGFEVGVHDLKHDGGLYVSRTGFRQRADRINGYLREWNAVGFRSGFMLRELDWLHDLEVEYDASTFDVDPFEPQPDGTGTIFPFILHPGLASGDASALHPGGHGRGYVELPYTLPQDSTLFLLLQEKGPEVWLRKLDWLIGQGGMALVNVHPDYLRFPDEPEAPHLYPVDHYEQLLRAVKARSDVWLPLARDLARWYRRQSEGTTAPTPTGTTPAPDHDTSELTAASVTPAETALSGRRIAVLLYSKYPSDSRPRRAAEALAQAGAEVELICPREDSSGPRDETIAGVKVTRVPPVLRRGGTSTYVYQYGAFLLAASLVLARRALSRKYDAVHAHNMPDFLVWAAWLPKWMGARIILDLHDPMPELFMSLYRRPREDRMIRLLTWIERQCVGFAHLVLTPNEAFRKRFVSRSGAVGKIEVIMNSPEEEIFREEPAAAGVQAEPRVFRVMHHGLIAERHGLDVAIEAVALLRESIPNLVLDIYGEHTPYLDRILALARERGIADRINAHGMVSELEIARQIRRCDLGLVPNRRSAFIEINLPTRIFEYLAMRCPVIVPETTGIRDYFCADDILYFQPDNPADLAQRIQWVHDHPTEAREIASRGQAIYRKHLWKDERVKFLGLVSRLLLPSPKPAA